MQKLPTAAEVAKFLTALAGAGGIIIANGLATGDVARWLSIAISIVTAVAVFLVPNAPATTAIKTADNQPATDDSEVPAFVNTTPTSNPATGNTTTTTSNTTVSPITDQSTTTTTPQATTETPLPPSHPPHGGGPA
jgi:hypothetical protein